MPIQPLASPFDRLNQQAGSNPMAQQVKLPQEGIQMQQTDDADEAAMIQEATQMRSAPRPWPREHKARMHDIINKIEAIQHRRQQLHHMDTSEERESQGIGQKLDVLEPESKLQGLERKWGPAGGR